MPVLTSEGARPSWGEIDSVTEFQLDPSGHGRPREHRIEHRDGTQQIVVVVGGGVVARSTVGVVEMRRRSWMTVPEGGLDLDAAGATTVHDLAQLVLLTGTWTGTPLVGVFTADEEHPLELHFHDFNEYWYILHGHATAYSEGEAFDIRPGDLVATQEGDEHGIPVLKEKVVGVSFECSPRPGARLHHLIRGVDGEPRSAPVLI